VRPRAASRSATTPSWHGATAKSKRRLLGRSPLVAHALSEPVAGFFPLQVALREAAAAEEAVQHRPVQTAADARGEDALDLAPPILIRPGPAAG
jgi:hypothetical protein